MARRTATVETAEPTPQLGDALEFLQILWAVDHGMQKTSKRMAAEIGVTGPQRLVVRILGRRPGILAGELSQILRVHPSTLTGVLRRLEDRGLISRKRDKSDLRRAHFRLTVKGRRLEALDPGTVEAAVQSVLTKMSPAHVSGAKRLLQLLADELAGRATDAG